MDWYRPSPVVRTTESVLAAQQQQDAERAETRQWWADQPARIAARLEEHQ